MWFLLFVSECADFKLMVAGDTCITLICGVLVFGIWEMSRSVGCTVYWSQTVCSSVYLSSILVHVWRHPASSEEYQFSEELWDLFELMSAEASIR